jgi:hypothetical protein
MNIRYWRAIPGLSAPRLDKRSRSRENTSIACADMKSFHRSLWGDPLWCCGAGFRDINKAKSASLIPAAIISDLGPTQQTGAIKKHG